MSSSASSTSRRTHSKSYPITLKNFHIPKDSLLFSSPPQPIFKSKHSYGTSCHPTPFDASIMPTQILADRTNLMHNKQVAPPKKRVRVVQNSNSNSNNSNSNSSGSQLSNVRRPLKSPKPFKLLNTIANDYAKVVGRTYTIQGITPFNEDDALLKTFRAPTLSKNSSCKKKKLNVKSSESISSRPVHTAVYTQEPSFPTRISDANMRILPTVNILDDFTTSYGMQSLQEMISTEQSDAHFLTTKYVTAEDFNKKLRNIFRGRLDQSGISELETSIAEEEPDLKKFRVFNAKPLMCQLKH